MIRCWLFKSESQSKEGELGENWQAIKESKPELYSRVMESFKEACCEPDKNKSKEEPQRSRVASLAQLWAGVLDTLDVPESGESWELNEGTVDNLRQTLSKARFEGLKNDVDRIVPESENPLRRV